MAKKKPTHLQQRFINNILIGMNKTDAYLSAGYKCSRPAARANAVRLITNDSIRKEIEKAQKKAAEKVQLTQEYILSGLMDVANRCRDEKDFQPAGANKALELLGKHLGIFEKDNRQQRVTLEEILAALPDEYETEVRANLMKIVSERSTNRK